MLPTRSTCSTRSTDAEAAQKAQSYLDISAFSRQDLIDQLLFDKFTQEGAEFGVTAVGPLRLSRPTS